MESPKRSPSNVKPASDPIMEKWRRFFQLSDNVTDEVKNRYAMGKLVQMALVQYLHLREVYTGNCFVKRRYGSYRFVTLNPETEHGKKLHEVIKSAGNFIDSRVLKTFRLQIFHDAYNPEEIGEEFVFQFYYGNALTVDMDFGSGDQVRLNMADCSFAVFLQNFGEILGVIRNNCKHLNPLPLGCEKRFRTSFCRKLPQDLDVGPFSVTRGTYAYAPGVNARPIGVAALPGAAVAAILRTCYSTNEVDEVIEEQRQEAVQAEVNEMMDRN